MISFDRFFTEDDKSSRSSETPSASGRKGRDTSENVHIPPRNFGINEDRWLPQNQKGAADKYDPKTQRVMWKSIVQRVKNQLPSEYRRLRYVGPFPPTDAPLFSVKKSDEVQRAHLFFGRHRHDPHDRIEVQIGRRGDLDWRVLSISLQKP